MRHVICQHQAPFPVVSILNGSEGFVNSASVHRMPLLHPVISNSPPQDILADLTHNLNLKRNLKTTMSQAGVTTAVDLLVSASIIIQRLTGDSDCSQELQLDLVKLDTLWKDEIERGQNGHSRP